MHLTDRARTLTSFGPTVDDVEHSKVCVYVCACVYVCVCVCVCVCVIHHEIVMIQ